MNRNIFLVINHKQQEIKGIVLYAKQYEVTSYIQQNTASKLSLIKQSFIIINTVPFNPLCSLNF